MNYCMRFASLVLGASLLVGCGAKPEPIPAPTAQDEAEQAAQMEDSMKAGEAAAAAAGGSTTSNK